jgi:hypothetical protein
VPYDRLHHAVCCLPTGYEVNARYICTYESAYTDEPVMDRYENKQVALDLGKSKYTSSY